MSEDVISTFESRTPDAYGASAAVAPIQQRLPPVVVGVSVQTGAVDIPPGPLLLHIHFSEPMMDGAWSVVEYAPGSAPPLTEPPRLSEDGRRLDLHLDLAPTRLYAFWLNDHEHSNFRDLEGTALNPYLVGFQTRA